jgi:hypothetical protein
MEQVGSKCMDFHDVLYPNTFGKSVEKTDDLLKHLKNNEYFTWRRMYVYENI